MRRTITMTAATIGLVIAFVVGGVALAARPAAAGPVRCIGIDLSSNNDPDTSEPSEPSEDPDDELEANVSLTIFPPDPEVEVCGPIVVIRHW